MKLQIFVALILLSVILCTVLSRERKSLPERISEGVTKLRKSNTFPASLKSAINDYKNITNKRKAHTAFCDSCKLVINQIIELRKSGANKDSVVNFLNKLCDTFVDWGRVACSGYINIEIDTILYIIDNRQNLTGDRVCAISFQEKNCQDPDARMWDISLEPSRDEDFTEEEKRSSNKSSKPLKILHITDIHYDPSYKPGSNSKCDVPLCCEEQNGLAPNSESAAGYWGDYHVCDMPWHSITNFMNHVNSTHKNIDLVYFTGDIISHKSWATTKDHNVNAIKAIYQLFEDTFGDVPVYPILGNHEPHPTDFYSPENVTSKLSTQWIFDLANEEWSRWLPRNTENSISDGGYYTVLIQPGFRIVALNSNVCFTSNLWLLYNDEDPYDQLKWLVKVLAEAEKQQEKVHILSHIPPGFRGHRLMNVDNFWMMVLSRVIKTQQSTTWFRTRKSFTSRFASTIVSQFNGHTHLDELRVFYDMHDSNKVINVAFNAGSFTTFIGFNPNYRLYDVDKTTLRVLDYNHYTYNLTKANLDQTNNPQWYKLYSLKHAYGLQDTKTEDFAELVHRMSNDRKLIKEYFRYSVRESDPQMKDGCDAKCLTKLLCSITSVEAKESVQCLQMKKKNYRYVSGD